MHFYTGRKRIGDFRGDLPWMLLYNLNFSFRELSHSTGATNAERQIQGALWGALWPLQNLLSWVLLSEHVMICSPKIISKTTSDAFSQGP